MLAGLFEHLADGGVFGRLARVDVAARGQPAALEHALAVADEEQLLEVGREDVDGGGFMHVHGHMLASRGPGVQVSSPPFRQGSEGW
ncbi:hypothetical protein D3C78_1487210 [compost metagenome]